MKISNKILMGAAIALALTMFFYTRALKAEYLKSGFKDPYFNFTSTGISGFTSIENRAGNILNVVVKRSSKFDVKVLNSYKHDLSITKEEERLIIDVKDTLNTYYNRGKAVIILCPDIKELNIEAQKITDYNREKKLVTEYPGKSDYDTMIEGFKIGELIIRQGRENTVKLKGNTIGKLISSLGGPDIKNADLEISRDNRIEEGYFRAYDHNHLSLLNAEIKQVHFNLTQNAGITLTGTALALLKK